MKPSETIEEMVTKTNIETNTDVDKVVLGDAVSAMSRSKQKTPVSNKPVVWRIVMQSKITKLATAAVIIIAALIGINQFGGSIDGASVAWAEVLEVMGNVPTVIFEITNATILKDNTTVSAVSKVYDAGEHGNRTDIYINNELVMQKYAIPNKNASYRIRPKQKTYSVFELMSEQLPTEQDFPRQYVKVILSEDYTQLGSSNIDGFDVEGVEVINSEALPSHKGWARLWVDVETNLPVQIELLQLEDDGTITKLVMHDFQWNAGRDEELFIPNIPDDYVMIEEDILDDSVSIEAQPDRSVEMVYADMPPIDGLKFDEVVPGLHFGIFTLGMTKDEVMEIRGAPTDLSCGGEEYTLDNLPREYYLSYDDISFLVIEGSVREITALSPFYKLICNNVDSLRVGDSEQKVIKILGKIDRIDEFQSINVLAYEDLGLTFEISETDRIVEEINFGPKP
jgi:hypothetical protein